MHLPPFHSVAMAGGSAAAAAPHPPATWLLDATHSFVERGVVVSASNDGVGHVRGRVSSAPQEAVVCWDDGRVVSLLLLLSYSLSSRVCFFP